MLTSRRTGAVGGRSSRRGETLSLRPLRCSVRPPRAITQAVTARFSPGSSSACGTSWRSRLSAISAPPGRARYTPSRSVGYQLWEAVLKA